MADSISQQIKKMIKKEPDISITELGKAFPSVRSETLKHYKQKFEDELGTKNTKKAKATKPAKSAKATKVSKTAKATKSAKGTSTAAKKKVAAPKKTAAKKKVAAPKKTAAKKTVSTKAVAKKTEPKKSVAKKSAPKKVTPKKTAAKKTASKKAVTKKTTAKSLSLKEQIFVFLDKKPNATFTELSKVFKSASENTIRGYKFAHSKLKGTKKAVPKKKTTASKKEAAAKPASKETLEKRLAAMEKQIQKLTGSKSGKASTVKASITAKAKELEGNLVSFIKEKRKGLDELQQHVTNEISSFLTSIKNKKE